MSLPDGFWLRTATVVAPELLGMHLSHQGVTVRLTEVEAYEGEVDPGSHAYRGRNERNAVMFEDGGRVYTYRSYGIHICFNLVCGTAGTASAVLIRSGEVVDGLDVARSRRGRAADRDLARGPGRLAQALAVTMSDYGSTVNADGDGRLHLAPGTPPEPGLRRSGPRVGLSGEGGDGELYPWRFWIDGDRFVSAYRPGKPRRAPRTR